MIALTPSQWIATGTSIALVLSLGGLLATRAQLSEARAERDKVSVQLKVSNASIATCDGELKKALRDQQVLANSDLNRMNASRQVVEMARAAEAARDAATQKLLASANRMQIEINSAPILACEASAALLAEWE